MNKSNRFGACRPASRASVASLAVVVTLPGLAAGVLGAQNQRVTDRAATPPRSTLRIKGLKARVEVYRDTYGIPHIYAASAEDAYFTLGYLHATGGRVRREVEAYCAGVNARFQEVGTPKLAEMFRPLGIVPAPWTSVDALAFPRYMGWAQSGTDTDVWIGMLVEKLGLAAVDELFPLDRPYEISTVPADQSVRPHLRAEDVPRLPADFDIAALELHRHFVSGRFGSEFALGSNNWAIDGTKSSTGKPLLANDPHLGFQLPSIWYTAHPVAPGLNITGVTFAGFPYTIDGSSGDYDWVGTIPDDELPFSLNPPQHYLASANGRPAPVGYPYYLGWMWDPSYRTRRIHQLLSTHDHIAVEQMEAFQMDTHDSAAESFVPVLIRAYDRKPFGDAVVRRAIDELRRWDFNATPGSVAPTIWSTWFELYRAAVWQDHFDAAGVEPWPGGWGYTGSNERQPELEVLEFLTRANPTSTWFDDVRTPKKETRDDVVARSS